MTGTVTKAIDWFESALEFRRLCGDAQSMASKETDQEFAGQMMLKANTYGLRTYISHAQLAWLCRIARAEMPRRSGGDNSLRRGQT